MLIYFAQRCSHKLMPELNPSINRFLKQGKRVKIHRAVILQNAFASLISTFHIRPKKLEKCNYAENFPLYDGVQVKKNTSHSRFFPRACPGPGPSSDCKKVYFGLINYSVFAKKCDWKWESSVCEVELQSGLGSGSKA